MRCLLFAGEIIFWCVFCALFDFGFVLLDFIFFFSSRRRHTRCALVTGVQTCALPISERLASLMQFCHQSARLRGKPTATVATHRNFSLYENGLSGIPGVHLNVLRTDDESELWLSIDRLHETKPPEVTSPWLRPWIVVARGPGEEPTLVATVSGSALIDAGTHAAEVNSDSEGSGRSEEHTSELQSLMRISYAVFC